MVGGRGDGWSPRPARHHGGRGHDHGDRADGVRNGRLHRGGRKCRRVGSDTDRRRPPGSTPAVGRGLGGTDREVGHGGDGRPRTREPAPALPPPSPPHRPTSSGPLLAGAAWCTGGRSPAARGPAGCLVLTGGIGTLGITRGAPGPGALPRPGRRPRDPQEPTRHDGSCSTSDRARRILCSKKAGSDDRGRAPTRQDRRAAPCGGSPDAHGRSRPTRAGLELARRTPCLPLFSGRRSRGY
jgi:hypothetical protein